MNAKEMKRRHFLAMTAALGAGAALAACAPKEEVVVEEEPLEEAPAEGEATEAPAEPAAEQPVELFVLGSMRPAITDAFHAQHPEIRLEYVPITGDKFEKLNAMFATGDPPDLFNTSDVNWNKDREIAKSQHTVLDELLDRDADEMDWEDIYPTIREYMKMPDGHYHFMPQWVNGNVMVFNIELFDEADVPYPSEDWTWDDMAQAGKELTKVDESGMVSQYGKKSTFGWWGEYYYYQRQAGLENWLSEDGQQVFMDEPEAIEGMQFYYDCIFEYEMADIPGEELEGGFNGGGYAMWNFVHSGSWQEITEAGVKWDIMIPPKGKRRDGGEIALDSTAIGQGSEHLEESWTFLKWNSGYEGGKAWVSINLPPLRESVTEDTWAKGEGLPDYPLNPMLWFDALPYNMPVHWPPGSWDAHDIQQERVDLMLEQSMTPEEVCKESAEEMRTLIASGGIG